MPFADALYACDGAWWRSAGGAPAFAGLKITQDETALSAFPGLCKVTVDRKRDVLLMARAGLIGDGGNSGFQGFNLAAQWGARRIALVGFDMRVDRGLHWHGRHAPGLNNPSQENVVRWRSAFMRAAPLAASLGIDVFNCNPDSALTAFRFADLGALDVGNTGSNRRPRRTRRRGKAPSAD